MTGGTRETVRGIEQSVLIRLSDWPATLGVATLGVIVWKGAEAVSLDIMVVELPAIETVDGADQGAGWTVDVGITGIGKAFFALRVALHAKTIDLNAERLLSIIHFADGVDEEVVGTDICHFEVVLDEELFHGRDFLAGRGEAGGDVGGLQPVAEIWRRGIIELVMERLQSGLIVELQPQADFDSGGRAFYAKILGALHKGWGVVGDGLASSGGAQPGGERDNDESQGEKRGE